MVLSIYTSVISEGEKMDVVDSTLQFAKREDKPVIVVYEGKHGISQRRVYIRNITADKITVYCMQKRAIRVFDRAGILSAVLADE
ncbi:MAG: hypothetical protein RSC25_06855 [Christensenella sp.]